MAKIVIQGIGEYQKKIHKLVFKSLAHREICI